MTARAIERRVQTLEQTLKPLRSGPCFIMASSEAEADREIERLRAEYPEGMPRTLFIMTLAQREPIAEGA
jgi:hypothetical protein